MCVSRLHFCERGESTFDFTTRTLPIFLNMRMFSFDCVSSIPAFYSGSHVISFECIEFAKNQSEVKCEVFIQY